MHPAAVRPSCVQTPIATDRLHTGIGVGKGQDSPSAGKGETFPFALSLTTGQ